MNSLDIQWEHDKFKRWDVEWNLNMSRVVDALELWCKDSGIKVFGIGFTQIALQAAFSDRRDAMIFKLRWHNA